MNSKVCFGTGLIAVDIIKAENEIYMDIGGTCGNVMLLLSYFGHKVYPIQRFLVSGMRELLLKELRQAGVHTEYIFSGKNNVPIIVQKNGPRGGHTFHFTCVHCKNKLPKYAHIDAQYLELVKRSNLTPNLFFFDRISNDILKFAYFYKKKGSLIYFEPSSTKNIAQLKDAVEVADVVKFSHDTSANAIIPLSKGIENKLFIETHGEHGLRYKLGASWSEMPGYRAEHIRNSSGCGDWFSASFIHSLLEMWNGTIDSVGSSGAIESTLQKAQAIASLNCHFSTPRGMQQMIHRKLLESECQLVLQNKRHSEEFLSIIAQTKKQNLKPQYNCPHCANFPV